MGRKKIIGNHRGGDRSGTGEYIVQSFICGHIFSREHYCLLGRDAL
jgi:hypothetical protein